MINFNQEEVVNFLAVVRKYMQLRGGLSQKDLADKVGVGVSTMSRFLNQKTKELDEQMIANIVAKLNVPLHEIIEFIDEESTERFKKLLAFYKGDEEAEEQTRTSTVPDRDDIESLERGLEETKLQTSATIKGVKMPFGERRSNDQQAGGSIREKLNRLSPRQKGFLTDFLDLDSEGKDLIVDVGNSLFRYFKQKNAEF